MIGYVLFLKGESFKFLVEDFGSGIVVGQMMVIIKLLYME